MEHLPGSRVIGENIQEPIREFPSPGQLFYCHLDPAKKPALVPFPLPDGATLL
jgi:hypothetical protein